MNETLARRIVQAFDAFRSGGYLHRRLENQETETDARWINQRYQDLKQGSFGHHDYGQIAEQAKVAFIMNLSSTA